jgi:hypothetical protein
MMHWLTRAEGMPEQVSTGGCRCGATWQRLRLPDRLFGGNDLDHFLSEQGSNSPGSACTGSLRRGAGPGITLIEMLSRIGAADGRRIIGF